MQKLGTGSGTNSLPTTMAVTRKTCRHFLESTQRVKSNFQIVNIIESLDKQAEMMALKIRWHQKRQAIEPFVISVAD